MDVSIRHVRKDFDRFPALRDVSLDIRSGELIALLGPSGSGKTTLLRLIAGPGAPDPRRDLLRRRGRLPQDRAGAQCRLRLPALRALPPHDRRRQYRLRPEGPARRDAARRRPRSAAAPRNCSTSSSSRAWRSAIRRSSPAASASVSRSPARSPSSRRCCSSTSRSARSTRRCAASCAAGCATSTTPPATPPSSSPTTRRRRWNSPTASS